MNKLLLTLLITSSLALAKPYISGAPQEIIQNIENRLASKKISLDKTYSYQVIQLKSEISEAIYPYGYFNPKVEIIPSDNGQTVIKLVLGELTRIEEITFDTENSESEQDQLNANIQRVIQSYHHSAFSSANLQSIQHDLNIILKKIGYKSVQVKRENTTIDLVRNTNTLHYSILLGPKYYVGEVTLNDSALPHCLEKFLTFAPGSIYQESDILQAQSNIQQAQVYSRVSFKVTDNPAQTNIQDVNIITDPLNSLDYAIGLGILANSDTEENFDPSLQLSFTLNNILECGGKIINNIYISYLDHQFTSDLYFPSSTHLHDYSLLSTNVRSFLQQSNDKGENFSLSFIIHKEAGNFTIEPSINYLIEKSSINIEIDQNPNSYTTKLLYPKLKSHFLHKSENNTLSLKANILGTYENAGSDITLTRYYLSSKNIFHYNSITVQNQVSYGEISTDDFEQVPLSMHFTLGGPDSVRGLENKEINQGKRMLLSRNAIQYPFKVLLLGGFFDTGYCSQDNSDTYQPSYGALLTYQSPYSRFNLSIGKNHNTGKIVIHFGVEAEEHL